MGKLVSTSGTMTEVEFFHGPGSTETERLPADTVIRGFLSKQTRAFLKTPADGRWRIGRVRDWHRETDGHVWYEVRLPNKCDVEVPEEDLWVRCLAGAADPSQVLAIGAWESQLLHDARWRARDALVRLRAAAFGLTGISSACDRTRLAPGGGGAPGLNRSAAALPVGRRGRPRQGRSRPARSSGSRSSTNRAENLGRGPGDPCRPVEAGAHQTVWTGHVARRVRAGHRARADPDRVSQPRHGGHRRGASHRARVRRGAQGVVAGQWHHQAAPPVGHAGPRTRGAFLGMLRWLDAERWEGRNPGCVPSPGCQIPGVWAPAPRPAIRLVRVRDPEASRSRPP